MAHRYPSLCHNHSRKGFSHHLCGALSKGELTKMPYWLIKSALQNLISLCPNSENINTLWQKYVTHRFVLDKDRFEHKLGTCIRHLDNIKRFLIKDLQHSIVFELGTGWRPVVPVGFYLAGSQKIISVDIASFVNSKNICKTLEFYSIEDALKHRIAFLDEKRFQSIKVLQRNCSGMSVDELFAELNIDYRIEDACKTGLANNSVDIIISNNVFEHISSDILHNILQEFRRIIKPAGIMSHYVDIRDHYAQFDKTITDYNYLKYNDRLWNALGNNKLHYQNRLRASEYQQLHQSAGFEICEVTNQAGAIAELHSISIAKRFRCYSEQDLLTRNTWIVSRPL